MDSMTINSADAKKARKTLLLVLGAGLMVLFETAMTQAQTRQGEVAERGAKVMPFDLEQTMHVFQNLEDGGLQKVVVKDPSNKTQIALIQAHLREESEKFRKGDFSDPAKIHGENMPGLAELKSGAGKIDILYTTLPDGAQIRYATKDPALLMAIHHWFDAQLSDHGQHASGHDHQH
jgi:hypothetical protein